MASKNDRINSLKLAIEEQRRDFDYLANIYEAAKVKNITFLAAGLALLGYLYTGNSANNLRDKLFIPHESYGVVIYGIAFVSFMVGLTLLFVALKPQMWLTAYDDDLDTLAPKEYEEYLKYTHNRYKVCSQNNTRSYVKKQTLLDISFIPLLVGAILLLLLKQFGG